MPSTRIALLALFITSPAFAQDGLPAAATPGPEHEFLKRSLGERTGTMKTWMSGPDGPAMELPVKETNTLILNGFWLHTQFESGPYKAGGVMGYDPYEKKYVGNWTDNMSPVMSVMKGTYDKDKGELTMIFDGRDPEGKKATFKSVAKTVTGQPEIFTMYMKSSDGKWQKSFQITYDD